MKWLNLHRMFIVYLLDNHWQSPIDRQFAQLRWSLLVFPDFEIPLPFLHWLNQILCSAHSLSSRTVFYTVLQLQYLMKTPLFHSISMILIFGYGPRHLRFPSCCKSLHHRLIRKCHQYYEIQLGILDLPKNQCQYTIL